MSSLFDEADEKTLIGANFVAEVTGELRRAFEVCRAKFGLTQKEVADRLGVSKSAVHRWLRGDANMTLRTLGEIAWAIDHEVKVELGHVENAEADVRHQAPPEPRRLQQDALNSFEAAKRVVGINISQDSALRLVAVEVKMPDPRVSAPANDVAPRRRFAEVA